ncbi:hypothetical protein BV22DRAFT_1051575 [Leucogyrophana mollusca]|uniref:Uncharacterized protein n=1 Tax=Leucogyrophana mollusca TaxID=85980 RepID=A0ACB8AZ43_9AGAM|nr:hypothetical protein BV22DRAFT_1051575 [Leucogyrophana mollusca]
MDKDGEELQLKSLKDLIPNLFFLVKLIEEYAKKNSVKGKAKVKARLQERKVKIEKEEEEDVEGKGGGTDKGTVKGKGKRWRLRRSKGGKSRRRGIGVRPSQKQKGRGREGGTEVQNSKTTPKRGQKAKGRIMGQRRVETPLEKGQETGEMSSRGYKETTTVDTRGNTVEGGGTVEEAEDVNVHKPMTQDISMSDDHQAMKMLEECNIQPLVAQVPVTPNPVVDRQMPDPSLLCYLGGLVSTDMSDHMTPEQLTVCSSGLDTSSNNEQEGLDVVLNDDVKSGSSGAFRGTPD